MQKITLFNSSCKQLEKSQIPKLKFQSILHKTRLNRNLVSAQPRGVWNLRKIAIYPQLALFILFNLATTLAFTQDTIPLSEIMVTATRIPVENYKTGRSVEVISGVELQQMPVSTVDEALRYITGLNINSRNDFGVQADIGMRGSTFSQVLVMVDNVRFNDPLTAHFNNNIPVALSEIARIEVIKGPAGASYGSDAVGGLIHIKTKNYLNQEQKEGFDAVGDLAIGQHNLHSSDLGVFYNEKKWSLSASYKSNIADGEQLVNPNFLTGVASDSLRHNFFDIKAYSASFAYRITDSLRAYIRMGHDQRDFAAQYFYTRSAYDESTENTKNLWTQFAVNYDMGAHTFELNGGYKIVNDFFEFNPLFTANEHTTKQTFLNFSDIYQFNTNTTISAGVQFLNKNIKSNDRGNHKNSAFGVYGVFSHNLNENLHANASLRLEYDANFGLELLPQASVSYHKRNYILRASYGRAVRAADFTERYVSYQIPSLSAGRNAGNPDLKAEKSNSFDFGADIFLPSSFKLSATVFYRHSTNLIDFALRNSNEITNLTNLQENTEYFYADNISKAQTSGIEIDLQRKFKINNELNINGKIGYTYIETVADTNQLSKYIANHPKHNVSFIIDARYKKFTLGWYDSFITRQEEIVEDVNGDIKASYFVSNLRLGYQLNNNFSVYTQVQNLTNTDYQEILGAKMPGRWWSLGVKWQ